MIDKLKNQLLYLRPDLWRRFANPSVRDLFSIESCRLFLDIVDYKNNRRIRINRINAVFSVDMMNSFDYYFYSVKPFCQKIKNITFEVVDFSTPRFHEINGFDDFTILCPTLAEPFVTAGQYFDFAKLTTGDVVFDLGAYCGLTAINFSKAVGCAGRVIAIEPDPLNYAVSKINLLRHEQVNGLKNVSLMQCAAAGSNKTIQFSSEGTMGSAAISIVGQGRGEVIDVDCFTLSEIAASNNLSRIDFVKMDIEGAEVDVLGGSKEFLCHFRPKLIVEPHMVGGVSTTDSVIKILQTYKYSVEMIQQYGVENPLIAAHPG